MNDFEYTVYDERYNNLFDIKKELNRLGGEGWEMVSSSTYKRYSNADIRISIFLKKIKIN